MTVALPVYTGLTLSLKWWSHDLYSGSIYSAGVEVTGKKRRQGYLMSWLKGKRTYLMDFFSEQLFLRAKPKGTVLRENSFNSKKTLRRTWLKNQRVICHADGVERNKGGIQWEGEVKRRDEMEQRGRQGGGIFQATIFLTAQINSSSLPYSSSSLCFVAPYKTEMYTGGILF